MCEMSPRWQTEVNLKFKFIVSTSCRRFSYSLTYLAVYIHIYLLFICHSYICINIYSYTSFLYISFQERRKMKICLFSKPQCVCMYVCMYEYIYSLFLCLHHLRIWDFWTALVSPCATWRQRSFKTWTNWRVPRQVSELVVNGALGCKWRILPSTRE